MKKFIVIYRAPASAIEQTQDASPEDMKKGHWYPQVSTRKPAGRAPRLLEADRIAEKIAMKVAFLN